MTIGVALLAAGCGDGAVSGSGGGGTGGSAGGTGGTGGAGGTTTSAPSSFGDWHAGWVVSWPSDGADFAIGKLGGDGATVAGTFSGTVTFPGKEATPLGDHDAYVARLDASGKVAWVDILAGTEGVDAWALDVDATGRVLVGGRFTGSVTIGGTTLDSAGAADGFVALLAADGSVLWARTIGSAGGSEDVSGLGFAPDGAAVIAGQLDADVDFGGVILPAAGGGDIYAAKLSGADGAHVWSRVFGDPDVQILFNAAVDPSGDLLLSGVYAGLLDFGVGTLPEGPPDGYGFVAKLDGKDGTATFAHAAGAALGYVTGAPDGFYFAGTLNGTADFGGGGLTTTSDVPCVAAFGPTGDLRWTQVHGDASTKSASAALPSASAGGLAAAWGVAGTIDFGGGPLPSAGKSDVYLPAFPASGGAPRVTTYGGVGTEAPLSISVGADGGALVVGTFDGTLDFGATDSGSGVITSEVGGDVFVAFLAPK